MIKLRPATSEDLPLLKKWDQNQHVIDSDPNDDWQWETELKRTPKWREQLIAELDDRPIGFVQIIDPHYEDSHYWGEIGKNKRAIDIWIGEKKDLNQGYGTEIMNLVIQRCFSSPNVEEILVDPLKANTKAHNFYKKFGFQFAEERKFNEDECYVYKLKSPCKK